MPTLTLQFELLRKKFNGNAQTRKRNFKYFSCEIQLYLTNAGSGSNNYYLFSDVKNKRQKYKIIKPNSQIEQ